MTMNASGTISTGNGVTGQDISIELGRPGTAININTDADVIALTGISSGSVTIPDSFWGKTAGNGMVTPGFDSGGYSNVLATASGVMNLSLVYHNNGTWNVNHSTVAGNNYVGTPTSGTWTSTPGISYEYKVTVVNITIDSGSPTSQTPNAPQGSWTSIGTSATILFISAGAGNATVEVTYTFDVRQIGTTTPVKTTTIEFYVENAP